MGVVRREVTIAGKDITTYQPKGNREYSHKDIRQYLKRFQLCEALRLIGAVSYKLFEHDEGILVHKGVPIFDGVLAYISMHLIECSNDYRSSKMTEDDLLKAIDMYFGLPEPMLSNNDNPIGCMVRIGSTQHDYDREARHTLPRTLVLYRDLWPQVKGAKHLDISQAVVDITGISLPELLILSLSFHGRAKQGFFRLYEDTSFTEESSDFIKSCFEYEKQRCFADWVSCNYAEFRNSSRANTPPSDEYEKFRFNPLHITPVVIPDRNPQPTSPQVHIAPIPSLITYRVTRGLYFALSDYFREKTNSTAFRNAFGLVFQEYIGLLLKESLGEENVIAEWTYGSKKQSKNTPDWLVIQGEKAVLIEVKQSGLFLPAKTWGDIETIQKDLKKSIGSGVYQMWKFEHDIESGLCHMPKRLDGVEIVEKMIVTYDRSYHMNSFMRKEIRSIYPEISEAYHWHTIAIEELEYFLGIVRKNFITALAEKRLDSDGDMMDFRDYYSRKYSADKQSARNSYLDGVFDTFFNDVGL